MGRETNNETQDYGSANKAGEVPHFGIVEIYRNLNRRLENLENAVNRNNEIINNGLNETTKENKKSIESIGCDLNEIKALLKKNKAYKEGSLSAKQKLAAALAFFGTGIAGGIGAFYTILRILGVM